MSFEEFKHISQPKEQALVYFKVFYKVKEKIDEAILILTLRVLNF